jgi:hypothetical protein
MENMSAHGTVPRILIAADTGELRRRWNVMAST